MSIYNYLVKFDVENNWRKETWINWSTGKEITNEKEINKLDSWFTHCSAFVSAVCFKLNVPMLIPPTTRTEGLANKQYKWLNDNGEKNNWKKITENEISSYVNDHLIIATCYCKESPNCGHIAIVVDIVNDDIYVCQAGKINSSYLKISEAFFHPELIEYWLYTKKIENI